MGTSWEGQVKFTWEVDGLDAAKAGYFQPGKKVAEIEAQEAATLLGKELRGLLKYENGMYWLPRTLQAPRPVSDVVVRYATADFKEAVKTLQEAQKELESLKESQLQKEAAKKQEAAQEREKLSQFCRKMIDKGNEDIVSGPNDTAVFHVPGHHTVRETEVDEETWKSLRALGLRNWERREQLKAEKKKYLHGWQEKVLTVLQPESLLRWEAGMMPAHEVRTVAVKGALQALGIEGLLDVEDDVEVKLLKTLTDEEFQELSRIRTLFGQGTFSLYCPEQVSIDIDAVVLLQDDEFCVPDETKTRRAIEIQLRLLDFPGAGETVVFDPVYLPL